MTAATLVAALLLFLCTVAAGTWFILRAGPRIWAITAQRLAAVWWRLLATAPLRNLLRRHPAVMAFVSRRFSRAGYLGVHVTAGLALSLGALATFGKVAKDVADQEQLFRLDGQAAAWLARLHSPLTDRTFHAITLLGEPLTLAALSAIVIGILAVHRRWLFIAAWTIALGGGGLLDVALKMFFRRPRPADTEGLLAGQWSFPSGHAMGSLLGYGMLAYLLVHHLRAASAKATAIATIAVLIFLIGLSRLYLGVHYFTDVIAGYAAAALWLSVCITGVETARHQAALGIEPVRQSRGASDNPTDGAWLR